jgi:SAM-dependent methyltransferase
MQDIAPTHALMPDQAGAALRAGDIGADGIIDAIGELHGRNKVAAAFYDGPSWRKFQPWERLFLTLQGGERRARSQILRHLPSAPGLRVLEVGIGDGENIPFVPASWEVHGVDIARSRVQACLKRFPQLAGRLAWAQGESLPYDDSSFDASFSIGGFSYFGSHSATLREMRRVTRPGGTIVVADEVTWLHRCGIGHLIGRPAIDAWWLKRLGLDSDFVEMVFATRLDLKPLLAETLPRAKVWRIWGGLGYCMVDSSMER